MLIQLEDSASNAAAKIETELLKSLQESNEQSVNAQFTLTVRNDKGDLIGGLSASTSYGWLLIKTLWVHKNHQRQGFGKRLMQNAETKGQEMGCHGAWLDTSHALARNFYSELGYSVFGELSNSENQFPPGHQRWFMRKYF
jgi:GNAT superfamily N-acetyltransferase